MELAFDVGGCSLRWRFVGASLLQDLLSQRPWEHEGGVILASVARDVDIERTLQGIAQLVRAYDVAGAVQLSVIPGLPVDLTQVLHVVAAIAPDAGGRRRLEALARLFDRPRAWVLGFDHHPGRVADALRETVENVRKIVPPETHLYMPVVVLAHRNSGRRGTDLATGYPVDSPYGPAAVTLHRLWSVYLHWRIAWFVSGRPGWAEHLGPQVVRGLALGDDDLFEQRLRDVAREAWKSQTAAGKEALMQWLKQWPHSDSALSRDLENADLLWHPAHDGARGLQPVPWVARALLDADLDPPARSLLRAGDACEPLAAATLARCLQLEAVLKARADAAQGGISDEVVARAVPGLRHIRDQHRARRLVPETSAARGTRLFDFAGLNDVLDFMPVGGARALGIQLRDVRNAMAHGHPPSWCITQSVGGLWRNLAA